MPSFIENVNSLATNVSNGTFQGYVSDALANANIATDKATEASASAKSASTSATTATTQAGIAIAQASNASASAVAASAYANINWAGFSVADGELIANYANGLTSTPSIVDGDFIITY